MSTTSNPPGTSRGTTFSYTIALSSGGLQIGKAERDLFDSCDVVESVAMNGLHRTCGAGPGDVLSRQGELLITELDRRKRPLARAANDNQRLEYPALLPNSRNAPSGADIARSARQRPTSSETLRTAR